MKFSQGLCLVAAMLLATAVSGQERRSSTKLSDRIRFEPVLGASLPLDVEFHDHRGTRRPLSYFFDGRPVILMPVYYRCPMLCGLELNGLVRCLRALTISAGQDFQILTISIDPNEDFPLADQKRKTYLAEYGREGAESGWQFLTGDADNISRLCDALGFHTEYDPQTKQYAHAAGLVICTPDGRIARHFSGVEFSPREIQQGLDSAVRGETATQPDPVQLFCYMYDPTTGKYGPLILLLLRAAGVLTVLALATGILVMLRGNRQRIGESQVGHG